MVCLSFDGKGAVATTQEIRTSDPNAKPVNLHLLPFVQVHGGVSLTVYPVDQELGIRRLGAAMAFTWHHSQDGWLESAEKIEAIALGSGGHCYLGEDDAGDAVVVSKDEYDVAWWERHVLIGRLDFPCGGTQ